jgi:hypothetical protein
MSTLGEALNQRMLLRECRPVALTRKFKSSERKDARFVWIAVEPK